MASGHSQRCPRSRKAGIDFSAAHSPAKLTIQPFNHCENSMRLLHTPPAALIGRTIIYRRQFWQVTHVEADNLRLTRTWSGASQPGLLSMRQLRDCRLYPCHDEVRMRYPRLLQALRWSCILTEGEAVGAVVGYLINGASDMGSEAVAHVGGSLAAIGHAVRCRHMARGANQVRRH